MTGVQTCALPICFPVTIPTKASVESAKADLEAAQHTSDAAGYTIKSTEATIKEAKVNLNKTTIYAPMDGIVSLLNVKKGEKVVGTLQMTGTEMMRIANFDFMEVRVDVSEGEIGKVKIGDTASVEVDAYLDRKFTGLVTQVANTSKGASSALVSSDQSTNFVVKIRILKSSYEDLVKENPKPFLPGMSATVDIKTKTKEGVISVPIQMTYPPSAHPHAPTTNQQPLSRGSIRYSGVSLPCSSGTHGVLNPCSPEST